MNITTLRTMKAKSSKKAGFSLIELMIVIVILGSLTALILPHFDSSEAEAKDTGCDASNYGTLRTLTQYRSLNGVYPSGMHTGFEGATATATTHMGKTGSSVLPSFTLLNMTEQSAPVALSTEKYKDSLQAAGIYNLASGGFDIDTTDGNSAPDMKLTKVADVSVATITGAWYEAWSDANDDGIVSEAEIGGALDKTSREITINGIPLQSYKYAGTENGLTPIVSGEPGGHTVEDGIVVPLFVTPTTIWNNTYVDGVEGSSKIQMAAPGQCPWLTGGEEFRYYMAVFKVYKDGSPAKLLGTMCPEGGSLNP